MSGCRGDRRSRVVIVGQVCRDLVCAIGNVPSAGGAAEVVSRLEMLGGKGANQAVAMAQLDLRPTLTGVLGDDECGARLRMDLRRDGVDDSYVVCREGRPTGLVVSVVQGGRWRYLEDLPADLLVGVADVGRAEPAIANAGTVVCQCQQPLDALLRAAELARKGGARVVLDGAPPQGLPDELVVGADALRADDREAAGLLGRRLDNAGEAADAARELVASGSSFVALAAGEEGNAFAWPGGDLCVPLAEGPVVDSTGAGDAMVAAIVFGLAACWPYPAIARAAARAAAMTVSRLGGRPALSVAAIRAS